MAPKAIPVLVKWRKIAAIIYAVSVAQGFRVTKSAILNDFEWYIMAAILCHFTPKAVNFEANYRYVKQTKAAPTVLGTGI